MICYACKKSRLRKMQSFRGCQTAILVDDIFKNCSSLHFANFLCKMCRSKFFQPWGHSSTKSLLRGARLKFNFGKILGSKFWRGLRSVLNPLRKTRNRAQIFQVQTLPNTQHLRAKEKGVGVAQKPLSGQCHAKLLVAARTDRESILKIGPTPVFAVSP